MEDITAWKKKKIDSHTVHVFDGLNKKDEISTKEKEIQPFFLGPGRLG